MAPKHKPSHEIEAFAGIDQGGRIAWGTVRQSRADCAELVERFAPSVADYPPALRVMPVRITFDLNRQLDMPLGATGKPQEAV